MRILQVISSAGMYGAERMMLTLSQSLIRSGHQCSICVFVNSHLPNLQVADQAREVTVPTELVPCNGRFDIAAIKTLRKLIEAKRIDVVHTHGYKANIYGVLSTPRRKTALISTCHNWIENDLATYVYARADRFALRYFDAVVAVSDPISRILLDSHLPAKAIRVIENGIDVARFTANPGTENATLNESNNARLTIGFVGRLSREKGAHILLDATSEILREFQGVRVVFVGDGPDKMSLERQADELGISSKVSFLGRRDDVAALYRTFDIVVLPSLAEGLPLTLLEAMASQGAVVATSVGAVPSVVRNEVTGLLVSPGDVGALKESIRRLLRDPGLRQSLGRAGRDLVVTSYSADSMCRKYLEVYSETMRTRSMFDEHAVAEERLS